MGDSAVDTTVDDDQRAGSYRPRLGDVADAGASTLGLTDQAHPRRQADCIFCGIAAGEAKATVLYEDDHAVAFVPRIETVAGHSLIVPKPHYADIYSIPDDVLAALAVSCRSFALRWRDHTGATGMNLLHASGVDAEQSVFHFHFHLLPRFANDGLRTWPTFPASP